MEAQGSPYVGCSLCTKTTYRKVFGRHHQELHELNPDRTFYCPYEGCSTVIRRYENSPLAVHLANKHQDICGAEGVSGARQTAAFNILDSVKQIPRENMGMMPLQGLVSQELQTLDSLFKRRVAILANMGVQDHCVFRKVTIP